MMARYGFAYYDGGSRYGVDDDSLPNTKGKHMAGNPLPGGFDDILSLAEDMADGCHQHEVTAGIKQNTETVIRAAITAVRSAQLDFKACETAQKTKQNTVDTADAAGQVLLADAQRVFQHLFGKRYSTEWGEGGWPDNSTGIPRKQDKRMNLLASLKNYFTRYPARENGGLGVTSAQCDAKFTALSNARDGLDNEGTNAGNCKRVRDTALTNLKKRMRGLITELGTILSDTDPRYLAFGLNIPGQPVAPDVPAAPALTGGGAGIVMADWPRARRAERYRIFIQIVGVDADFRFFDKVTESEITFSHLTGGQTLKVRLTAANSAGESLPGPERQIVVPV